jgi:hypothetical protein
MEIQATYQPSLEMYLSLELIGGAGRSYPMGWCYKRITNGAEDNVWYKYTVLEERSAQKEKTEGKQENLPRR